MRRTEQVQGLRLMKFEEIYERTTARRLSQHEAASILGVSERTFRRWRDRFEASGAEGLYDRRLGRPSGRRLPVDTVMAVLELFDTRIGTSRPGTSGEAELRTWLHVQLQLGSADLAGAWPDPSGATPWGASAQAGTPAPWRHDAAPRRLVTSMGGWAMVGFDRHHGRCHLRYIFRPVCRRGRHHEQLPGARRGDCGEGAVLFAVCRSRLPLLAYSGGGGQGGQGLIRPRSAAPSSNWVSS